MVQCNNNRMSYLPCFVSVKDHILQAYVREAYKNSFSLNYVMYRSCHFINIIQAVCPTGSADTVYPRPPESASNPDLRPFDLEIGMPVASKVGNLPSKFGHARRLDSRIIHCVRDRRTDRRTDWQRHGQTDGRTDKSNAYCPLSYGRGHNNKKKNTANPPYPFILISQPESWYSFCRSTKDRRIRRLRWPIIKPPPQKRRLYAWRYVFVCLSPETRAIDGGGGLSRRPFRCT